MTPDQMRVAIAKDMGEHPLFVVSKAGYYYRPGEHGYTSNIDEAARYTKEKAESLLVSGELMRVEELPPRKFDSDLNACHEFEIKMTGDEWRIYLGFLAGRRTIPKLMSMDEFQECWNAGPAKRCEAYCRMKFPERFKQ